MAECIVYGDKEPSVATVFDYGVAHRMSVAIGVISPVRRVGRAGFSCDVGTRRIGDNHDLIGLLGYLHHSERCGGSRQADDHVNAFGLPPFAGNRRGDVELVLCVGAHKLYRLAEHHAAKILDRHLGAFEIHDAADVGINGREVVKQTNLEWGFGLLCESWSDYSCRQQTGSRYECCNGSHERPSSVW